MASKPWLYQYCSPIFPPQCDVAWRLFAAHEKEIEEKEKEIEDFVRVAADMESRKEKALKQLLLNRDNITRYTQIFKVGTHAAYAFKIF